MIIGIDGYAGAGKDTVADIFVKVGFTKISFADALREATVHSTGFPLSTFIDREIKDKPFLEPLRLSSEVLTKFCTHLGYPEAVQDVIDQFTGTLIESPRHLLITLGTEVGRSMLSPTIWLDQYQKKCAGLGQVVTPDCRFDNERELIKSMKGLVWLIKRSGYGPEAAHISATGKWSEDKYDVVVENKGLIELRNDVGMWWSLKGSNLR